MNKGNLSLSSNGLYDTGMRRKYSGGYGGKDCVYSNRDILDIHQCLFIGNSSFEELIVAERGGIITKALCNALDEYRQRVIFAIKNPKNHSGWHKKNIKKKEK